MKMKVKIEVTLKKSVLDPQGSAVEKALKALGYDNIGEVRVGKYLELTLEKVNGHKEAAEQVEEMCRRLLTNPVIEDYNFSLMEVEK